jgi:DNA polymerase-4
MDAFYASIEQRDKPQLKGKPIAVGGKTQRGVVAAASYEARKFGVRSAMPMQLALKRCPALVIVPPRFDVYKQVSLEIREIFHFYTPLVEPLSLDEAFLDVTENSQKITSATEIARQIKDRIKQQTTLTASAGISSNKFLAKIASDMNKPDGIYVIRPEFTEQFVEQLPIEKFFGIGKATAAKMHQLGIVKGIDLKKFPSEELTRLFGKMGMFYYDIARGTDNRPVNPSRERKSLAVERTFEEDLKTLKDMVFRMQPIEKELNNRLLRNNFHGRTLTLKVKYANFKQLTKSITLDQGYFHEAIIKSHVKSLLYNVENVSIGIRLLGLSVSNSVDEMTTGPVQLKLDF